MRFRRTSRRPAARQKPILGQFVALEDRCVPAVFNATIDPAVDNVAAIDELIGFFKAVNTNGDLEDTINLFPGGRYVFNTKAPGGAAFTDGGTALPVFRTFNNGPVVGAYNTFTTVLPTTLTINGNGATFVRPAGAESFRFLRAFGAILQTTTEKQTGTIDGKPVTTTVAINTPVLATMNIDGITFEGGNVFDFRGIDLATGTKISEPAGGAIRTDLGQVNVSNSVFLSNTATQGGGAVYIGPTLGINENSSFTGTVSTFTNVKFVDNFAGGQGGAVAIDNTGDPVIRSDGVFKNSTIQGNLSINGAGGVHGLTASAIFDGVVITGNRGNAGGVEASSVEMNRTLISGNVATGSGTGAVEATEQMLTVFNSTISGNQSGQGGAVRGQGSGLAVEFINSTLHDNLGGNAALLATKGEVVVAFSTVTNNRTSGGDTAGLAVPNNILTISQSVISGNRVPNSQNQYSDLKAPLLRNQGYNFIGIAPNDFVPAIGDRFGKVGAELDPLLGPLTQNGGPPIGFPPDTFGSTPTRLPAAGSPLLGGVAKFEASRLRTDQRGLTRPPTNADIGAVMVQPGEALPQPLPLPPPVVPPPPPITGPLVPPPPTPVLPPVIAIGPGPLAPAGGKQGLPPPGFLQSNLVFDGSGPGGSKAPAVPNVASLLNPDGTVKVQVTPLAGPVPGGLRVAAGDVNGDGVADLVVATGPGVVAQVSVFDGVTGSLLQNIVPFGNFTGGLFVAVGDVTGDNLNDLVISPDFGGGPRVVIYETKTFTAVANFFGIEDPNFRGGVRVAVGDVNGDGVGDLLVAAGTGGGPRVTIWKGGTESLNNGALTIPIANFFVFEPTLRNGVYIASGDVNGDGFADIIAGAGPLGAPRVLVLSGKAMIETQQQDPIANFFAGDPNRRDGVPVAVANLDNAPDADVVTGGGTTSTVNVYFGSKLVASRGAQGPDAVFDPLLGYSGGVFVG